MENNFIVACAFKRTIDSNRISCFRFFNFSSVLYKGVLSNIPSFVKQQMTVASQVFIRIDVWRVSCLLLALVLHSRFQFPHSLDSACFNIILSYLNLLFYHLILSLVCEQFKMMVKSRINKFGFLSISLDETPTLH